MLQFRPISVLNDFLRKQACARLSGNRCDESKRRKRSVIEVDHFGPIYILESGYAWFKTGSNISGDANQEFTQGTIVKN